MSDKPSDLDEWSAYWRDGRGAACRGDDTGLYRGAIGRYWQTCFEHLPDRSRVLDLATGNGAVLEIALGVLRQNGRSAALFGVDRARIAPRLAQSDIQNACRLRWLSPVSNEALPFAARMFDQVTSQFGVEYGDTQNTIAEVKRVLKPGGACRWICHWREGDIGRGAALECEDIEYFNALNLAQLMLDLLQIQIRDGRFIPDSHRISATSPQRLRLQQGLNAAFERLRERGYAANSNLHVYLKNLAHLYQYREQHAPDLVQEKIRECGYEMQLHGRRLRALVEAALTAERLTQVLEQLSQVGMQVIEHRPLMELEEAKMVGYLIHAKSL